MLVNSSLCMGRALSYTDYKTTTGFPTLVAPAHALAARSIGEMVACFF